MNGERERVGLRGAQKIFLNTAAEMAMIEK